MFVGKIVFSSLLFDTSKESVQNSIKHLNLQKNQRLLGVTIFAKSSILVVSK